MIPQKNKQIRTFCYVLLLVLLRPTFSFSQVKETVSLEESDFESVIQYSASDSIYADFERKILYLFGNAKLNYDETSLQAAYMEVDLNKKEVYTTYRTDSNGTKIGIPVFVENGDTIKSEAIRYNFETKKGYIQDVLIKQDEFYLSMGAAKVQTNKDIHFTDGKFTTCNLEDPHFHFHLSRAVLIPDKRIVTGPMNLWILGVPTPVALPFAIIPLKKKREKLNGFILPQFSIVSAYGMGIQDLGYYLPINDRFQTTFYGTVFSRGSFGARNVSEYKKLYKYTGSFELGYTRFRYGWPDSTVTNTSIVKWNHVQDQKANPKWNFGANVNFNSKSNNKQSFNIVNPDYFNNTLNSDLRLSRRFGSKPISADMKMSMRQNSQSSSGTVSLVSPILNFQTTSRIFPFKKINKVVGLSYNAELQNKSTFADSLIENRDFERITNQFMNGASHKINVQGTFSLLKSKTRLTPQVNYSQLYNFQQIEKSFTADSNKLVIDTLNRGGFTHKFDASASLSTTLFSYYRFIGKRKTVLRHVATPSVSFTFNPTIQNGLKTAVDTSGKIFNYSTFERSVYSQSYSNSSGKIAFSLNNTFELKQKDDRDTVTGFKKTKIIDNFFLNADYDIFKDTMKWSNLNMRMVINPNEYLNITINATHSFYSWNDTTGVAQKTYAFQTNQGIGRIDNGSVSTGLVLTSRKNQNRLAALNTEMAPVWNPVYQQWITSPNQMVYFEIPWKLTIEHIVSLNTNTANFLDTRYTLTNTFRTTADMNITENWKIQGTVMYDANVKKVSNLNLNLYRNIHCWNVAFTWTPIGTNKSFLISLRGNASMLQNANINLRRPPIVF